MNFQRRADAYFASQRRADDVLAGTLVPKEASGSALQRRATDIGGGLKKYSLFTPSERDAVEVIDTSSPQTDTEIALAVKKREEERLWDREEFVMNKINKGREGGTAYINPSSFGSGVPERRLAQLKSIQDDQLLLAKIQLQGGMGMNEKEWDLLYAVESGDKKMSDFAPQSIHVLAGGAEKEGSVTSGGAV